jgi:hypothetical protein
MSAQAAPAVAGALLRCAAACDARERGRTANTASAASCDAARLRRLLQRALRALTRGPGARITRRFAAKPRARRRRRRRDARVRFRVQVRFRV